MSVPGVQHYLSKMSPAEHGDQTEVLEGQRALSLLTAGQPDRETQTERPTGRERQAD